MSDYRHYRGKFKVVAITLEEIKEFAVKNPDLGIEVEEDGSVSIDDERYSNLEITIDNVVTPVLIEMVEEKESNNYDYCHITPIGNNEFLFDSVFYDGGTCLSEMIESEIGHNQDILLENVCPNFLNKGQE